MALATQGVPMEPQPRRAALGGVYTYTCVHPHGAPLLMGRQRLHEEEGEGVREKEKGMTQGVLSFHGALLSMIEPFFFTFRPSSFTFV